MARTPKNEVCSFCGRPAEEVGFLIHSPLPGGFVGIFSYASTVISGIGFGYLAQRWGWNAAYAAMLTASVVGGGVLLAIWRAKPL